MSTFNDIVQSIPQRFRPEKAQGYQTVLHFDIQGDGGYAFTVTIQDGTCKLIEGLAGQPVCTVKTKVEHYVNLELGKLNPQMALMMGKVKVSNIAEMMRFAKVFRPFDPNASNMGMLPQHEPTRKPAKGPLKGVTIIDFTRLLPGPIGTMMMADMGAEVIKVEDPSSPDYIRDFAPFVGDTAAYYLAVNRSKRSLAVNYRSKEGKQVIYRLVKEADIFIEQFRPGVMGQLGLGYEQLKAINPKLIYVSITGYGQDGPYAQAAGHDLNYIGYSGLLGITGNVQHGPTIPGGQIADIAGGGYMAVNACLVALLSRNQTGEGQWVDVSMTDCMVPLVSFALADYSAKAPVVPGKLPLSGGLANYNTYRCADGKYVALGALEPKFWEAFCDAIHQPDWKLRMMDTGSQMDGLHHDVAVLFSSKTSTEWLQLASQHDFCLTSILSIDQLSNDPQLQHRQMVVKQQTLDGHNYYLPGVPLKFSGTPATIAWQAPTLGQDTVAIMQEAGYSNAEITQLLGNQTIKQA